jgi:hypothetical protein
VQTADNYRRVYKLLSSKTVLDEELSISVTALYMLARPSTPKEAADEVLKRAADGESIGKKKAEEAIKRAKAKANGIRSPLFQAKIKLQKSLRLYEGATSDGERKAAEAAARRILDSTLLPRLRWEGEVRLWRTADVVPLACIV